MFYRNVVYWFLLLFFFVLEFYLLLFFFFYYRLYLNGDGMGKKIYIFIFFVILRGDYDVILIWFFFKRVIFIVFD